MRRIALFESHTYPSGKFDSQGNYKYWFDIISSRVDAEVKNLGFIVTKDTHVTSDGKNDDTPNLIMNLELHKVARQYGMEEETNDAVEELSGWGNRVWKKVKGMYEAIDLKNFYVINQTARTLDESPVIERHELSQSDLRAKSGTWDAANVKLTLEGLKTETYKQELQVTPVTTTVPYYETYERNGEVCLKDLKEVRGEDTDEGDEDKYVFAKIIAAGSRSTGAGVSIEYILFAQKQSGDNCDIYKEVHRGRYEGRWWRKGLFEILFDLQVRANVIGNQISQGLEYASKVIFTTPDKLVLANIVQDLKNGDVIRTAGLQQVEVRMEGIDQLIADWNRIQQLASDLSNSNPIVQGALPLHTSEKLGMMLNQNANKLYDHIRQKLSLCYSEMYEDWLVPKLAKSITAQEVLNLTGDSQMLDRMYDCIVDAWYVDNLLAIGPHTDEMAQTLKAQQLANLKERPQLLVTGLQQMFKDYLPRVVVNVGGNRDNASVETQKLQQYIGLEQDTVRRSAMIEMAMRKDGIDVGGLPKSPPAAPAPQGSGNAPADAPVPVKPSNPQPIARKTPVYSA